MEHAHFAPGYLQFIVWINLRRSALQRC